MSIITSIVAAHWEAVAAAVAAIAGAIGFYLKGRSDAASKAKLEDVTNANAIRKAGAAARAVADPSSLHDDGYRRD